jgi:putative transposase
VLSLYGKGMTVRDIQAHVEELYDHDISKDLVSSITDGILQEMQEWRNRPLDKLYPMMFIDGFVVKCRLNKVVCNRTVYVVFGIDVNGEKDVLALTLGEEEGAKYWLSVLTDLKNRGLEDIFILCADGLKGLPEAVEASFPKTIFQTCVVHMVRHSLNYVPYNDKKKVATDLKKIYSADTLELAEGYLDDFELTWGEKYAAIVKSWRSNWSKIIPFFDYPKEIRKVIYTTNIIESLNRTLRKSVKNRGHFPTEDAVMKVLYLAIKGVSKKWTMPIRDWKGALNQFAIRFDERLPSNLLG